MNQPTVSFRYQGSRIDVSVDGKLVLSTYDIATIRKLQEGQTEENDYGFSLENITAGSSISQMVFSKSGDTYIVSVRGHVKAELEPMGLITMPEFIAPDTKYTCWACGYRTLNELPTSSYEICSLCGWEEDEVQDKDPYYRGGANEESLYEHQQEFLHKVSKNSSLVEGKSKDPAWQPVPAGTPH